MRNLPTERLFVASFDRSGGKASAAAILTQTGSPGKCQMQVLQLWCSDPRGRQQVRAKSFDAPMFDMVN